MFSPSLTEILHTTQESNCDSPDCPHRRKTNESDGIFLVSWNVKRKQNEKKIEAKLNEWLYPEPKKCDGCFYEDAPPTAQTTLPENIWYQSCLCDDLHTSCNRVFKNGNPWVLPVFFGDLAMIGQLKGPEDLPEILEVLNSSYCLVGITFWKGNHYNARVYYDCKGTLMMACSKSNCNKYQAIQLMFLQGIVCHLVFILRILVFDQSGTLR